MTAPLVILADDHPDMRQMVALVLSRNGFAVQTAADGLQLVERCRENPDVAAIVTDVRMPGLSGLDALRRLRDAFPDPTSPVRVVVTAFGDHSVHESAGRLGATCFDKPFDPDELAAMLRNQLGMESE